MSDYIEREAFLEQYRSLYCSDCDGRKNGKGKLVYEIGDAPCRACGIGDMLDAVEDFPAVAVPQWQTADTLPDSERNIFICYGNPAFRSVCVGHYDHEMERFYEDRNFFAKPIYDAMYWCDMPRLPDMEG